VPNPAALSEAAGLYELGARMPESSGAPAALAEAGGLMQLGWRPEHMGARPACAPPHPAAKAGSLQHAPALRPEKAPRCRESPGELQSPFWEDPAGYEPHPSIDPAGSVDSFAAQKLTRDKGAFFSTRSHSEALRSNPAQISARQARFNSMREGFGDPAKAGRGSADRGCMGGCMDGCTGTSCYDHCEDRCRFYEEAQ